MSLKRCKTCFFAQFICILTTGDRQETDARKINSEFQFGWAHHHHHTLKLIELLLSQLKIDIKILKMILIITILHLEYIWRNMFTKSSLLSILIPILFLVIFRCKLKDDPGNKSKIQDNDEWMIIFSIDHWETLKNFTDPRKGNLMTIKSDQKQQLFHLS